MPTIEEVKSKIASRKKFQDRVKQRKERYAQREALKTGVSLPDETRQRLYLEASAHPSFEGMTPDEIKTEVDQRITRYLTRQPYWVGHPQLDGANAQHRSNRRRYLIERGLITPNAQPEHLARRNKSIDELIAIDEAAQADVVA